jgi:L-aminopeptidase/D-esterase-like protein
VLAGQTNSIADVAGIRIGHVQRSGDGWLTGVTVVLPPPEGAVAGVDVRGGGPGTRETDLLDPQKMVERVHAVVLSGGSAYGLAAADGVMTELAAAATGFPVGPEPGQVVPIVPAAVLFDLGRGGDFGKRPTAEDGRAAVAVADAAAGRRQGCVGAGTGAVTGSLKGGIGTASAVLTDGTTVAALMVANAVGSAVDPATGELYGSRFGLPGEFPQLRPHPAAGSPGAAGPALRGLSTTIGVVATDAVLTKAQCAKVAGVGHDGLARAIRPAHSMFDGDTIFALATGTSPAAVSPEPFHELLAAAADCVSRAIAHAMLQANPVTTPAGYWPSYALAHLSEE